MSLENGFKESALSWSVLLWIDLSAYLSGLYPQFRWWSPKPQCDYTLRQNLSVQFSSVQSLSRVWLFATPWTAARPASCPSPIPELAQTHVHWVSDAIQPSHPLLSPSPPTFNLSQYQGRFQWVSSSHQVAKVLEIQLQHQSFQWIFRTDFLQNWLVRSPCSPRDSQESSPVPQFKSISYLVLNLIYGLTLASAHGYWKTKQNKT